MRKSVLLLVLVLLILGSKAEGRDRDARHVKTLAKQLTKQLAKVQTAVNASPITSRMSFAAAVGYCKARIPLMHADGELIGEAGGDALPDYLILDEDAAFTYVRLMFAACTA